MIEYYGWLNINPHEEDEKNLSARLLTLKNTIQKIIDNELQQVVNRVFSLQILNGNFVLSVIGSTNHKTKSVDEVINLFFKIAEMAPGTYGLLYLYDDEDKDGKNDEFQVYKVAKGKVTVEKDTLLSPYEAHISFKRP